MDIKELFRTIELFDGLTDSEFDEIAAICDEKTYRKGRALCNEGEVGGEFFIIKEGAVEVTVSEQKAPRVIINLGTGQIIGEMALVDRGPRSATVRAIHEPTVALVIRYDEFHRLCNHNTHIGYLIMLNLAADLSFKLRHRHLSE